MFWANIHRAGSWSIRIGVTMIVIIVTMLSTTHSSWNQSAVQAQGESGSGEAKADVGRANPGTLVQANFTQTVPPPSAEQRQELNRAENESFRDGPKIGQTAPAEAAPGAGLPMPRATGIAESIVSSDADVAEAANTFTIFRNSTLPIAAVGGTWANVSGRAHEPSTGANGKNVFQTGNWYATRSLDNGATWTYVNPYTIFGTHPHGPQSFCCDQVTLYDPLHDRQWWVLQYGGDLATKGGLKIANSSGNSLFTSWCYYNIDATWFGFATANDAIIDYNDMAIGKNYLYISSNLFPAAGGQYSGILKLPIDNLVTCGAFSYARYRDTTHFTFKLVQGTHRTMYWGSNWANTGGWTCSGCVNGNAFRVYQWPESTNTISWFDRAIAGYVFYTRGTGQNCASASGIVKNWCMFSDSRVLGGALSEGEIHFTFNAKQTTNRAFPYTRWVRFRESDKVYLGYWDLFAQWGALLFLSISPNNDGAIGGTFAWGGGTGTTNYYPGGGLLINDDYTTDVGNTWGNGISFFLYGAGNPCGTSGLYRWGDYLTARPYYPAGYAFIASNFAIKGANCGSPGSYSEGHNVVFGRGRDLAAYNRWSTK
jgi:hypothetical protein